MSTAPRSCPHSRPPRIINELTNQPTHRQPFCDRIFMLSRTFLSFALPKAPAHVYTRLSNTVYGLPLSLFTFIHVHAFHLCEYVKFSPHLTEFATERRPSPPESNSKSAFLWKPYFSLNQFHSIFFSHTPVKQTCAALLSHYLPIRVFTRIPLFYE